MITRLKESQQRADKLFRQIARIAKNWHWLLPHWPLLVFLIMPIAVLGPLFAGPGYVLHYDMVFAPHGGHINIQAAQDGSALYQSLPVAAIMGTLGALLPMDAVEKFILCGILFFSAFNLYRTVPLEPKAPRVLGGLLYALNPFTYDRLMAGHWHFLIAYSLLPWIWRVFLEFYHAPSRNKAAKAALLWTVLVVLSPHYLFIVGLLFVCFATCFVRSKKELLLSLLLVAEVILFNIWWLIPLAATHNFTQGFTLEHFQTFATRAVGDYGLWFTMLSLQGFWHAGWLSVESFMPFWPLVVCVWLFPVFVGLAVLRAETYKKHHRGIIALLAASALALVLASGPVSVFAGLNDWLYTHLPGMAGMREAQKLLALLALTYAVLLAYGLHLILLNARKFWMATAFTASFITIVVMAWPMFWGSMGQLRPVSYPASWESLYQRLLAEPPETKVLVLPWELYLDKTFAQKLVANPAGEYFGPRAIAGKNSNLLKITDYEPAAYSEITKAIRNHDGSGLVGAAKKMHVRYILFVRSGEDKNYIWIKDLPETKLWKTDKDSVILLLT